MLPNNNKNFIPSAEPRQTNQAFFCMYLSGVHYAVHARSVANHVADFTLLLLKQEQGKLMGALFGK
jgi:hypothetical protein